MRTPSFVSLACALLLAGCGAPGVAGTQAPIRAVASAPQAAASAVSAAQLQRTLKLIGAKLYGAAIVTDFQHNDMAIAKQGRNAQGNAAWLVLRDVRATADDGRYAFVATEYTKDDAGTMQSQYKVYGVADLKADALVEIRKEVEDRDPR